MSEENKTLLREQLAAARGACDLTVQYDGTNLSIIDGFGSHAGGTIEDGKPYQSVTVPQKWANRQQTFDEVMICLTDSPLLVNRIFDDGSGGYTSYY